MRLKYDHDHTFDLDKVFMAIREELLLNKIVQELEEQNFDKETFSLNLENQEMIDEKSLAKFLHFKKVEHLNLKNSPVNHFQFAKLLNAILTRSQIVIQSLDLSDNPVQITSPFVDQLCSLLTKTSLKKLMLNNNKDVKTVEFLRILEVSSKSKSFEHLEVQNCMIQLKKDFELQMFTEFVEKDCFLKKLMLEGNPLKNSAKMLEQLSKQIALNN